MTFITAFAEVLRALYSQSWQNISIHKWLLASNAKLIPMLIHLSLFLLSISRVLSTSQEQGKSFESSTNNLDVKCLR